MTKKVLVISTYPIDKPQHGGQKRVEAIVKEYRRAKHHVKHLAIYMDYFYPNTPEDNIAIPWVKYHFEPAAALVGDLMLADILQKEKSADEKFTRIVSQFKPDIIQVEQGFLYKTVRDSLNKQSWRGVMINSTHNIEADLKRHILEDSAGLEPKALEEIVARIDTLERFSATDADWTIACTEADAKDLVAMGSKQVILAPNGIGREIVDQQEVQKWEKRFESEGVNKVILYVGSAHPPNLSGYKDMIGEKVGFLNDDTRFVMVGGIADMIYGYGQSLPNYLKELYMDHILFLGRVEEKTLSALLHVANQIILPINEGGGSNLKTAEAILADKFVVGTEKAFHSYEKYLSLPNIVVADSGKAFRLAMDTQLHSKKVARSATEKQLAEGVLWKNALKLMVERISTS